MKGAKLKIKKSWKGLGGRAQRLPPNAFSGGLLLLLLLLLLLVVVVVVVVFGEGCSGASLKLKKSWRAAGGGGVSASSQGHQFIFGSFFLPRYDKIKDLHDQCVNTTMIMLMTHIGCTMMSCLPVSYTQAGSVDVPHCKNLYS